MSDSQVSGCQFAVTFVVKAHAIPCQVSPASTIGLCETYSGSSSATKPLPQIRQYAMSVPSAERCGDAQIRIPARGHAAMLLEA